MTTQAQRAGVLISRLFAAEASLKGCQEGQGYSGYRDFYSGHINAYETALTVELLGYTYVPLWANEVFGEWLGSLSAEEKEAQSGWLTADKKYVESLRKALRSAKRAADQRYEQRRALLDA
jgi:hypothetical protein